MGDAERRVRRAVRDAVDEGDTPGYDDMVWNGDDLVPRKRESPLDRETLDERNAHGMGHSWEAPRE